MNMLKIIGRLVVTPITITADIITMGGVLTDEPQSYTGNNLEKIMREIAKEGNHGQ